MVDIKTIIGKNVKLYRRLQGMTLDQLASKIGIKKSYLSLIENGKKNISVEKLDQLAKALNISIEKLVKN